MTTFGSLDTSRQGPDRFLTTSGSSEPDSVPKSKYAKADTQPDHPFRYIDEAPELVSDWSPAIKSALDGGGAVQLPGMPMPCLSEINVPFYSTVMGEHRGKTVLHFSNDLGPGKYGLKLPENRGGQNRAPRLYQLGVDGPASTLPFGSHVDAEMCGVYLSSDANMTDCDVRSFRSGVVIREDHNTVTRCKMANCSYNVNFADDPHGKGDHTFVACNFDGASIAGIVCEGNNQLDGVDFLGGHFGFSPFGLLKLDGPTTGASGLGLLGNCFLHGTAFEMVGNSAIRDKSTGTATGAETMSRTLINLGGWIHNPKYADPDTPQDYAVQLRQVDRSRIIGNSYPFTTPTNGSAAYHAPSGDNLEIVQPFDTATFSDTSGVKTFRVRHNRATARLRVAAAAFSKGDLVEYAGPFFQVQRLNTKAFAGVAQQPAAASGERVLVATDGTCQALAEPVDSGGRWLVPDATTRHHLAQANSSPSSGLVVGVSEGSGGAAGGSLMNVQLSPRL